MSSEEENARLREELRALQTKYKELEETSAEKIRSLIDENELLAEANQALMENAATYQRWEATAMKGEDVALSQIPDELLLPGDGVSTTQLAVLNDVHKVGNLLSVASPMGRPELAVSGGVDKRITVHDWKQERELCAFEASGPVLGISFRPCESGLSDGIFVACYMDARHALLRLVNHDGEWRIEEIASFQDHTRHGAMKIAWSSCGRFFATGSNDKTLNVYQCTFHAEADVPTCEKIKSFYFNGTVEAITFIPPSTTSTEAEGFRNELLAISVRDDCYMHYVDCKTMEKERINMNQDGIEHVSYTIMDLRISPSGKYLLVATDKDRHFICAVKSNVVLRNFYGHNAGAYSQPRALWHPSEKYIISNTEENGTIYVWGIASERIVETIDAHDKLVRDLTCSSDPAHPVLMTVSYDKRLKVWNSLAAITSS